jgi:diadenosine tetraphosphatase ApaH/serine/threonine PP2A family protein phosphatase
MPDAVDTGLRDTYWPLDAARVVYGHVHRPSFRDLNEGVVANSGSVGMPWDGDPRAAYLILDDDKPTVIRVAMTSRARYAPYATATPRRGPTRRDVTRGRFLAPGRTKN